LLVAIWGIDSLTSLLPRGFPRLTHIHPDARVLFFTIGISVLIGCLAGLAPGLRVSQPELAASLNESGRGSTESGSGRRLRGVLVVVEIVLALVLLSGGGLLVQSFLRLQGVKPGYDPHNVLTARLSLPDARYPHPAQAAEFYRNLLARASTLPGVQSITAAWRLPLSGSEITLDLDIEERPTPRGQQEVTQVDVVALNYFHTMRMALVHGRDFNGRDERTAPAVAIVSESFAKQFFPGDNPIGKRIKPAGSVEPGPAGPPWREIVGVVADARAMSLRDAPAPLVYLPHAQFAVSGMALIARTANDPQSLLPALRRAVAEVDKDVPIYNPRTLEDYLASSVAQPRFNALLVGLFSLVALLLAAAGIYGVMSYSVTQRTQEIGIRLALGAQRSDVLRLIMSEGMRLVGFGVIFGLVAVVAFTRLLQGLLFGIGATHLPTLAGVVGLLALVALIACWWPARRASGVDPMVALREG
jgi:putative ABC transport system permease protein